MIPRHLFESLGGFDPIYKPAYYEDTDLALRVRQAGRDVLYQPQSTVVHFEGISHGTDDTQGLKKHQQINRGTFEKRWSSVLASHRANGNEPDQEKDRGFEHRVLLIDKCTPSPDRDAGSVVLLNLMLVLRHLGYQPTFIPDDNYANLEPYTPLCQSLGIECLYAPHVTSVRQHLKQQGQRYNLVILFRPDLTSCHLASVRRYCPQAKVIYYPHDLHFIRLEREGTLHNNRSLLHYARKSRSMELSNSSQADSTIVVSTSEQAELQQLLPQARVDFLPLIFSDQASTSLKPRFGNCEMVFVGSFNHTPNADAVRWFVSDILPKILATLPQACLHVVGANPPKEIVALAGPSLQIHGFVQDLDRFFAGMALSVVPLRFGAGMKGKVGSALRCGLPVVSTSIGCEGMALADGEGAVIADSAEAFSDAVVRVLSSENLWSDLSSRGLDACSRLWGKQTTLGNLQTILEGLQLPAETQNKTNDLMLYPFSENL
jgi:glycosyltransferase involved in cell wall biosynthesis